MGLSTHWPQTAARDPGPPGRPLRLEGQGPEPGPVRTHHLHHTRLSSATSKKSGFSALNQLEHMAGSKKLLGAPTSTGEQKEEVPRALFLLL